MQWIGLSSTEPINLIPIALLKVALFIERPTPLQTTYPPEDELKVLQKMVRRPEKWRILRFVTCWPRIGDKKDELWWDRVLANAPLCSKAIYFIED